MEDQAVFPVIINSVKRAWREYFSPLVRLRRSYVLHREHARWHDDQEFLATLFSMLAVVADVRLDHLTESEFQPLLAYLRLYRDALALGPHVQTALFQELENIPEECESRARHLIFVIESAGSLHLSKRLPYQDEFSAVAPAVASDIEKYFLYRTPRVEPPMMETRTQFLLALRRVTSLRLPVSREVAESAVDEQLPVEHTA
jgi:hypothetical protein